jgi:hypothetical protein
MRTEEAPYRETGGFSIIATVSWGLFTTPAAY